MRLHIAVGITPDGDYSALYVGDDGAVATSSIREAGDSGKIVRGLHFRNPHHIPHKVHRFPDNSSRDVLSEAEDSEENSSEPETDEKPAKKAAKASKSKTKEVASPEKEEPSDADHFKKSE